MALAFAVLGLLGNWSLVALAVGTNLLVYGCSCCQTANQIRVLQLGETVRARLNTLYVPCMYSSSSAAVRSVRWPASGFSTSPAGAE
jgi:hypothetical protein